MCMFVIVRCIAAYGSSDEFDKEMQRSVRELVPAGGEEDETMDGSAHASVRSAIEFDDAAEAERDARVAAAKVPKALRKKKRKRAVKPACSSRDTREKRGKVEAYRRARIKF